VIGQSLRIFGRRRFIGYVSAGQSEVVQAGDAEHGVIDTVALEATVAENLPPLGIDDDLMAGGVPVILRLLGDLVVALRRLPLSERDRVVRGWWA
jgi:hypothetical protein